MALSDFVAVSITLTGSAVITREAFGVPMVAAYHTHFADRFRQYPAASALTSMVSDGFQTFDPAYRAVQAILAQAPCPEQVAIGRRGLPFTQTLHLQCMDATTGDGYAVTVVGSDGVSHTVTYTIPGSATTTTVATAIAALLTALSGIGTVTHATDTITITQAAGLMTDLKNWTPNFHIADVTADPGIATDLAAILAANSQGWYGLALDSNSALEVEGAAVFIQATGIGGKFFFWNNSDFACVDGTVSTDVFSVLKGLSDNSDLGIYSGKQLMSFAGAAAAGLALGQNPGSYNFAWKTLINVPADDESSLPEAQQLVLNTLSTSQPGPGGKLGNYYKLTSGQNILMPGTTPNPAWWADIKIFLDWFQVNVQADLAAVMAGLPKVPITDFGIGLLGDAIDARIAIGGSADFGGIDLTRPHGAIVPRAATLSTADRNARNISGLGFFFFLTNGIVTVEVKGTVSP